MSTFRCDVVPVTLEPHPNADSLSLVRVGGYTVCVRTADWEGVVICTTEEQTCPEIGRLQLKMVSNRYLEKS